MYIVPFLALKARHLSGSICLFAILIGWECLSMHRVVGLGIVMMTNLWCSYIVDDGYSVHANHSTIIKISRLYINNTCRLVREKTYKQHGRGTNTRSLCHHTMCIQHSKIPQDAAHVQVSQVGGNLYRQVAIKIPTPTCGQHYIGPLEC